MKALFGIDNEVPGAKVLNYLKMNGITEIDEVVVLTSKKDIIRNFYVKHEDYAIAIIYDAVTKDDPITLDEFEEMQFLEDRLVLVILVDDDKCGTPYMEELFKSGYYSALYTKDASFDKIVDVMRHGRSKRNAKEYYGLNGKIKPLPIPARVAPSANAEASKKPAAPVEETARPLSRRERRALAAQKKAQESVADVASAVGYTMPPVESVPVESELLQQEANDEPIEIKTDIPSVIAEAAKEIADEVELNIEDMFGFDGGFDNQEEIPVSAENVEEPTVAEEPSILEEPVVEDVIPSEETTTKEAAPIEDIIVEDAIPSEDAITVDDVISSEEATPVENVESFTDEEAVNEDVVIEDAFGDVVDFETISAEVVTDPVNDTVVDTVTEEVTEVSETEIAEMLDAASAESWGSSEGTSEEAVSEQVADNAPSFDEVAFEQENNQEEAPFVESSDDVLEIEDMIEDVSDFKLPDAFSDASEASNTDVYPSVVLTEDNAQNTASEAINDVDSDVYNDANEVSFDDVKEVTAEDNEVVDEPSKEAVTIEEVENKPLEEVDLSDIETEDDVTDIVETSDIDEVNESSDMVTEKVVEDIPSYDEVPAAKYEEVHEDDMPSKYDLDSEANEISRVVPISDHTIVEEHKALSSGQWADVITDEMDMSVRCELVKKANLQLARESFNKLISFLPDDVLASVSNVGVVKEALERNSAAKELLGVGFEENVSQNIMNITDIASEGNSRIVGVYCDSRSTTATLNAFTLAKCIGGATYVQMPGTKYIDSAYDILDVALKCKPFIPHLQQIYDGYPYPHGVNDVDGVNVVCSNPSVDILDSWNISHAYKVLYGAKSPIVVDLGSRGGDEALIKDVISALDTIVFITPMEDVAMFVTEQKRKYGITTQKIVVLNETKNHRPVVRAGSFTSISCPYLNTYSSIAAYDGQFLEDDFIKELVAECGFEYHLVERPKKKFSIFGHHEPREKVAKRRKGEVTNAIEIAVCGSARGAGATYDALMIATCLARKYRVAFLECNDHRILSCFGDMNGIEDAKKSPYGDKCYFFSYRGIDYFPRTDYESFIAAYKSANIYDYVVIDCGTDLEERFPFANIKVAAMMPGYWNCDNVYEFRGASESVDVNESVNWLVAYSNTKELADYRKMFRKDKVYGVPFNKDPLAPTKDIIELVGRLINVRL